MHLQPQVYGADFLPSSNRALAFSFFPHIPLAGFEADSKFKVPSRGGLSTFPPPFFSLSGPGRCAILIEAPPLFPPPSFFFFRCHNFCATTPTGRVSFFFFPFHRLSTPAAENAYKGRSVLDCRRTRRCYAHLFPPPFFSFFPFFTPRLGPVLGADFPVASGQPRRRSNIVISKLFPFFPFFFLVARLVGKVYAVSPFALDGQAIETSRHHPSPALSFFFSLFSLVPRNIAAGSDRPP